MKKLLLIGAAFAVLLAPAIAAEKPVRVYKRVRPVVVAAPVYSWTGLYIGVNAGANWRSNNNLNHSAVAGPCDPAFSGCSAVPNLSTTLAGASTFGVGGSNNASFIGGGQIGYNYQFGSWVAGIETDIAGMARNNNNGGNFTIIATNPNFPTQPITYTATATNQLNYLGTLRGRIGFLATPSLLVFGTAGLAYGQVESTTTESARIFNTLPGVVNAGSGGGTFSQTRAGWTAGGGFEWRFAPSWSVKGEYLYYDLGSVSYNTAFSQFCVGGPCGVSGFLASTAGTTSFRYTGSVARVGLNYKFGNYYAPVVTK